MHLSSSSTPARSRKSVPIVASVLAPLCIAGVARGQVTAAPPAVATVPEVTVPEAAVPTWSEHVAPLIHRHCADCHRTGQAAPFSLLTYRDVQKRGETIAAVVGDRFMPPWHPVDGFGEFRDTRRLPDADLATIVAWVEGGMPRGDAEREPSPPEFPDEWYLGEPDLVVEMPAAFPVPADGPDIYRNFVIQLGLAEDRWVTAIEVRPAARSVLHHVLFSGDETGEARRRDGEDGQPGFRGMGGVGRGASLGTWAVGGMPRHLPEGLAMRLPAGSDLVLASHFHPSGKAEQERTRIGLYFADQPPARSFTTFMLPPMYGAFWGVDIPAGEAAYRVTDSFELPAAMELVLVGGHAHYLCRSMQAMATTPDGETVALFRIADWDFDWQNRYAYQEPIRLPAGTRIDVEIVYDNSSANPHNQFDPPREVQWGLESTDEMGAVIFGATPVDEADMDAIRRGYRQQTRDGQRAGAARLQSLAEQRIRALDADGDDRLSRDETPQQFRALFDRLDRGGTGSLPLDDVVRALTRQRR